MVVVKVIFHFIPVFTSPAVAPLFFSPKKTWMNGSYEETHNSVFPKKVWNRFEFENTEVFSEIVARFQEEYDK